MDVDKRFKGNKLLRQVVRSKTHRADIIQAVNLGIPDEDIIRVYEEYYTEMGFKTITNLSGHSEKLKKWK